jgi:hypothetical protein
MPNTNHGTVVEEWGEEHQHLLGGDMAWYITVIFKYLQRGIRGIVVSRWVRVQTNRSNANDEATPAFDLHFRTSASCACFPAGVLNRRDEQQCRRRACILLPSRYSLFTRVFSIVPNNTLSPTIQPCHQQTNHLHLRTYASSSSQD